MFVVSVHLALILISATLRHLVVQAVQAQPKVVELAVPAAAAVKAQTELLESVAKATTEATAPRHPVEVVAAQVQLVAMLQATLAATAEQDRPMTTREHPLPLAQAVVAEVQLLEELVALTLATVAQTPTVLLLHLPTVDVVAVVLVECSLVVRDRQESAESDSLQLMLESSASQPPAHPQLDRVVHTHTTNGQVREVWFSHNGTLCTNPK